MAHCVHTMLAEVRTSWENWNPTPMPSFPVPPASIQSMAVQSSRPSHPIQEEVDKEGRQKKAKSHPLAAKHLRKSTSNSAHPSSVHFGAFWHRVDGHLPCLWPNVHSPPFHISNALLTPPHGRLYSESLVPPGSTNHPSPRPTTGGIDSAASSITRSVPPSTRKHKFTAARFFPSRFGSAVRSQICSLLLRSILSPILHSLA